MVFVGGAVLVLFRERLSQALEAALIWVVVGLLLVVGYTYRFELRDVGDRVMAELMPGHAARPRPHASRSCAGAAAISRSAAQVNGARVAMVLDTGASAVVLTQEAAKAAGLPLEVLTYTVNVDTANGRTRAAPVTLDRIAVGGIVERSVPALIAQPGQLKNKPARHELPQPAGKLGGARRQAAHARLSVSVDLDQADDKAQRRPAAGNRPKAISSLRLDSRARAARHRAR